MLDLLEISFSSSFHTKQLELASNLTEIFIMGTTTVVFKRPLWLLPDLFGSYLKRFKYYVITCSDIHMDAYSKGI